MDSNIENLLDIYSGLISKKQAERLLEENFHGEKMVNIEKTDALGVLVFINEVKKSGQSKEDYMVDINDTIYRIFNYSTSKTQAGKEIKRRVIVLGKENATVEMVLYNKFSDLIDSNCYERGNRIFIKNAILDITGNRLISGKNTIITKISQDNFSICNYKDIKESIKNADIVGKVIEIDPIRYINKFGGGQTALCNILITDGEKTANVSLWGQTALATASLNLNEIIKIEFCNINVENNFINIRANENSRIFASKILEAKLPKFNVGHN
ncbi:MAG: hypothetical protein QXS03_01590 [Candidatus Micrarchaeaceae archaeon]